MSISRQAALSALDRLARRLAERGVGGHVHIVGGAAMMLRFGTRTITEDVDAFFAPAAVVREVADELADDLGLEHGWLNNAAQAFAPLFGEQAQWEPVLSAGDFEVAIADAHCLLAMKIRASRPGRDDADLAQLLAACGVTSLHEAVALYDAYYPDDRLPARATALLEGLLGGARPAPFMDGRDQSPAE